MVEKISITKVAELAGVAASTVSRVLNNPDRVHPDTYEKVMKIIEKVNFKPNAVARSMRTGRTSTIGVILPDIKSLFFPELIDGIETISQQKGYKVFICNSDEDSEKEKELLKELSSRNVDGIILSSVTGNNIEIIKRISKDIPIVIVDRLIENIEIGSVGVDDYKGIYKATKYFIEKGYKNINYIGPINIKINSRRAKAFKDAFNDSELPFSEDFIIKVNSFKISGGIEAAKKILDNKKKNMPKAIIAANDMMAIGLIRKLKSNGYKIPENIEIIGFDNIPLSELMIPSLSTVAQPIKEMGKEAINILFKEIEESKEGTKTVLLDTFLILRETTKN